MKKAKRMAALTLALLLLLLPFLASCRKDRKEYKKTNEPTDLVCISVKDYGSIVIELYPEIAPITVANFKSLVAAGFYTESSFHRIIDDFMIQGGRSASGERAETIFGEFTSNGHRNDLLHTRGVISMARTSYPNSASSEFFIVQTKHASWLDGDYAAFGKVISGMKLVDRIAGVDTNASDAPEDDVIIREIYFVKNK